MGTGSSDAFRRELTRKAFHLSALWVPVLYAFYDRWVMLALIVPITLIAVAADFARLHYRKFGVVFNYVFSAFMRPEELIRGKKLGSTFFLPACCISILIFSKTIAISAICVLLISDTAAALVGKRWGKHKFGSKSAEGTLAFMVSAALVIVLVGIIAQESTAFFIGGFFAAMVSGMAELYSKQMRIDDNFSIPLSVGAVLVLFTFFR